MCVLLAEGGGGGGGGAEVRGRGANYKEVWGGGGEAHVRRNTGTRLHLLERGRGWGTKLQYRI